MGKCVDPFVCICPRINIQLSTTLRENKFGRITGMYPRAQENSALLLYIEGHTDNTGTHLKNQTLINQYAKVVYKYLALVHTCNSKDLVNNPVADNLTAEERKKNRMVEFWLIKNSHRP